MPREPALARRLQPQATLAGVAKKPVTPRAQRDQPAPPGLLIVCGALQHGRGEYACSMAGAEGAADHRPRLCLVTHMAERELALERAKAASGIATRGAGRGLRYLPSLRGPGGLLPAASAELG